MRDFLDAGQQQNDVGFFQGAINKNLNQLFCYQALSRHTVTSSFVLFRTTFHAVDCRLSQMPICFWIAHWNKQLNHEMLHQIPNMYTNTHTHIHNTHPANTSATVVTLSATQYATVQCVMIIIGRKKVLGLPKRLRPSSSTDFRFLGPQPDISQNRVCLFSSRLVPVTNYTAGQRTQHRTRNSHVVYIITSL